MHELMQSSRLFCNALLGPIGQHFEFQFNKLVAIFNLYLPTGSFSFSISYDKIEGLYKYKPSI